MSLLALNENDHSKLVKLVIEVIESSFDNVSSIKQNHEEIAYAFFNDMFFVE